jgi:acetylornithine deacetylase/succinyl-diaminopimelate desuccinylase-like protein
MTRPAFLLFALSLLAPAQVAPPDWARVEPELLRHYQALVRIDTGDPPANELPAVEYLKRVLEAEGIPVKVFAKDPKRPNLVARLKGNGRKRPLLIMAHTDTVGVQPEKWKHPPFGAVLEGGYVYGRGTVDDKDNLATALILMLELKRKNVPLDRDVIFLAEAGEEGNVQWGIQYMVENHWPEIEAEFSIAEGGSVIRRAGRIHHMQVATAEKQPHLVRLIARGTAGHGSRPTPDNAVVRLSQAVAKVAAWQTPMRLNDTTRAYFERLATISAPEDAARYNGLLHPEKAAAIQEHLRLNEPSHYSMLRTSVVPTILRGGFRRNVIPSEAEATLDVRSLPDENMPKFLAEMKQVVGDAGVEIVHSPSYRPLAAPSRIDTEMFRAIEAAGKRFYPGALTLPSMSTGATDKVFLQTRGVQTYGIGPLIDEEDAAKGYGAHSDQERLLEQELYRFARFQWDLVTAVAAPPK